VHQLDRAGKRFAPKSAKSRRTVTMPAMVAEVLRVHMTAYPPLPDGSLFYRAARKGLGETQAMRHYYQDRSGEIADRLATKDRTFPAGVSSHLLRHSNASMLAAAGLSASEIADRLGHSSTALVHSTYVHLMPDAQDRAAPALDAVLQAAQPPPDDLRLRDRRLRVVGGP
jgi:integrase